MFIIQRCSLTRRSETAGIPRGKNSFNHLNKIIPRWYPGHTDEQGMNKRPLLKPSCRRDNRTTLQRYTELGDSSFHPIISLKFLANPKNNTIWHNQKTQNTILTWNIDFLLEVQTHFPTLKKTHFYTPFGRET